MANSLLRLGGKSSDARSVEIICSGGRKKKIRKKGL